MNTIKLNNNVEMPQLGFGVFRIPAEETAEAVYQAIKAGYRSIDTAILYGNEVETAEGIHRAIADGLVTREELFITNKLFIQHMGEEKARKEIEASLSRMNLTYLDLILIHQPYGDLYGTWRAFAEAQKNNLVRAIGTSNFDPAKLIEFVNMNDVAQPQINQIEVNPWNQKIEELPYHDKLNVKAEAWSPFAEGRHDLFTNDTLKGIGDKYGKSVGQVILRWLIQQDMVVLTKSVKPERMAENINVFDFELTEADMEAIATLDKKEAFLDNHNPEIVEWFMSNL